MNLLADRPLHRALDASARTIGAPMSIKGLTDMAREIYGRAHYSSMNETVHKLLHLGLLRELPTAQRPITLNFDSPELPDYLAETELRRKHRLLREYPALIHAWRSAEEASENPLIDAACLIEPERNAKLNRIELLTLSSSEASSAWLQTQQERLGGIARHFSLRVDGLHLTWDEFLHYVSSSEINPVRPMLDNKLVLKSPGGFWRRLARELNSGWRVSPPQSPLSPRRLSTPTLWYNLNRLGYREFGPQYLNEDAVCAESIVSALLGHDEPRWHAASAVILAKNQANPRVLAFLSEKHGQGGALLGVLDAMPRPRPPHLEEAARLLVSKGAEPKAIDHGLVESMMRLYNA